MTTTMNENNNIYRIAECNLERLEKKLLRIHNKCAKYGCDFSYEKLGEEYKTVADENNNLVTIKYIVVHAEGTAIVNDWQFVATLEHQTNGNIIRKYAEDVEIPDRYYFADAVCEHCQTRRRRKDTYIIQNLQTGEFKQVGKSCLCDYTCGMSASNIANYISYFDELIKGEEPYKGSHSIPYFNLREFLMHCKECCDKFGYVKSQDRGYATKERAEINMMLVKGKKPYFWNERDFYKAKAELEKVNYDHTRNEQFVENALAWIADQTRDNNYIHNLKAVCGNEWIPYKQMGIACSLIPTYDREIEYQRQKRIAEEKRKAEQKAMQKSEHIGNVGDRITINVEDWRCLASWDTQWGTTWMYQFRDANGNIYIWKSSKYIDEELENFTIKGTVKDHGEFRDVKQTIITRCKVTR